MVGGVISVRVGGCDLPAPKEAIESQCDGCPQGWLIRGVNGATEPLWPRAVLMADRSSVVRGSLTLLLSPW